MEVGLSSERENEGTEPEKGKRESGKAGKWGCISNFLSIVVPSYLPLSGAL